MNGISAVRRTKVIMIIHLFHCPNSNNDKTCSTLRKVKAEDERANDDSDRNDIIKLVRVVS